MTDATPSDQGHLGDLLSALLDHELSLDEEMTALRHLQDCAQCAAELESVRLARSWVRGLPAVEPPFGFIERILFGPEPRSVARRSARRWVGVAALTVSAAAAVALIGVTPPRETPVAPSVARLVQAHATGASVDNDPLSRLAPLGVPVSLGR